MWITKKYVILFTVFAALKKIYSSHLFIPPILTPVNFFSGKVLTDQFRVPKFIQHFILLFHTKPRNWSFVGPPLFVSSQGRDGGGEGEGWGERLLAHKSPDRIWLQKCRAGEQSGRNESEIPQTEEGYFSFKRLRIVGFHAYSDGTRKDFNFFASFSLALNKSWAHSKHPL